ncbi:MAG TPA: hypothetical protein VJB37_03295 [Patescibacteria group bacterium]|nr:hypothetical protein [Patescibacteria group bacterium]
MVVGREPGRMGQDQEWSNLYGLKNEELGFESGPNQQELIQEIATQMGLEVRFEESKELSPSTFVIVKGDKAQRSELIEKVKERMSANEA